MLRDNGYKTFLAGKWHLGSKESWPTDHSYDINKGGWGVGSPRGVFFRRARIRISSTAPRASRCRFGLAKDRFISDRSLCARLVQDCPICGGMVEAMDGAVGIVIKKLDEFDLSENTAAKPRRNWKSMATKPPHSAT